VSDERIRVVEQGYDVMADRFLEWSQGVEGDPRPRLVERFMEGLPDGAAVVDLAVEPAFRRPPGWPSGSQSPVSTCRRSSCDEGARSCRKRGLSTRT
jgi:hypothetical protein